MPSQAQKKSFLLGDGDGAEEGYFEGRGVGIGVGFFVGCEELGDFEGREVVGCFVGSIVGL